MMRKWMVSVCVYVYGETGGTDPVSQWWTPPDLGAGVLPMCGVLIPIFLFLPGL